jgi:hypothetical protein
LKQDRAQPQHGGDAKKIVRFLFSILQAFEMRDHLPCLEHEAERLRYLGGPRFNDGWCRQLPKRVVDFRGGKPFGIVTEHLLLRQFLRVEAPLPLFVAVAAGADVKSHVGRAES